MIRITLYIEGPAEEGFAGDEAFGLMDELADHVQDTYDVLVTSVQAEELDLAH